MKLGAFEIEERIGKGGMAVVHRATWSGGVRPVTVAVKFLVGDAGEGRDVAFPREARNAARLSHPNVVTLLDIGRTTEPGIAPAETPYLVMEWVDGGSLATRPPKTWTELRSSLLDVASGLSHAHARGVLHRDVKPGNVLRDRAGVSRLVDFGVARTVDDPEQTFPEGRIVGTPNYMSPEQIAGGWRDEGPWTDVYGLGAMAWRLATGATLYSGKPVDVLTGHVRAPVPSFVPLFEVPEGFEEWLRRCLEKRPSKRFETPGRAAEALMFLTEERPTREYRSVRMGAGTSAIPQTWPQDDRPVSTDLRAAGAGLFGMRQAPLVGRDEEKGTLWAAYRAVDAEKRPGAVVLRGDAGCGKSALAQWLVRRVRENDYGPVVTTTHEPVISANAGLEGTITAWFGLRGLDRPKAFDRLQTQLDHLGFEPAALIAMDVMERIAPGDGYRRGLAKREDWFDFLIAFADGLSRRNGRRLPVVWFVDDMQWGRVAADFVTTALESADVPILFVLTERGEVTTSEKVHALPLDWLGERHLRQFVRSLLPVAPGVEDVVVRRAEGSPLFAAQILGDWVGRNILEASPLGYQVPPEHLSHLPDGIHDIWQQRLRTALRDADLTPLAVAAILGADCRLDEWQLTCEALDLPAEDAMLDRLTAQGLLEETELGFRFTHTLLRDSVLQVAGDMRGAHQAAADVLERLTIPSGASRERVARHLHSAEAYGDALAVLTDAMEMYWQEEQYDALVLLGSQLDAWADDAGGRSSVRYAFGRVWYGAVLRFRGAKIGEYRPVFEDALERIGGDERLAELAVSPDPVASRVAFRALSELAMADYYSQPEPAATLEQLRLAQAIASRADLHSEHAFAALFAANAYADQNEFDAAEEQVTVAMDGLRMAGRMKSKTGMSAYLQRSRVAEGRRNYDAAIAAANEALETAVAVGHRTGIALCHVRLGELFAAVGTFDSALDHSNQAHGSYAASGARSAELCDLNALAYELMAGLVDADQGRRAERHEMLWTERGFPRMVALARACLAITAARGGDGSKARTAMQASLEFAKTRNYTEFAALMITLANVNEPLTVEGATTFAQARLDELTPFHQARLAELLSG